jgi:hypothetical protein
MNKDEAPVYGTDEFRSDSALKGKHLLGEGMIIDKRVVALQEEINRLIVALANSEQQTENARRVCEFALKELNQRNTMPSVLCEKNHLRIMYDKHVAVCPYCSMIGIVDILLNEEIKEEIS